ncbi:MAG: hypothetical protein LBT20_06775 [Clostridiales bacterium]|jgi:hypothetical protein|nr:hypothetical protein [Clostridiales bacterium]
MKVVFESKNVQADYLQFNRKKVKRIALIFSLVVVIFGILILIAELIAQDGDGLFLVFGIFLIVYGVVIYPLMLFANRYAAKRQIKTNRIHFADGAQKTTFLEDGFIIEKENKIAREVLESYYTGIYKIEEHKEIVMIYLSNMSGFLFNKNSITEGTFSELREKLKGILGKKYIMRK